MSNIRKVLAQLSEHIDVSGIAQELDVVREDLLEGTLARIHAKLLNRQRSKSEAHYWSNEAYIPEERVTVPSVNWYDKTWKTIYAR